MVKSKIHILAIDESPAENKTKLLIVGIYRKYPVG